MFSPRPRYSRKPWKSRAFVLRAAEAGPDLSRDFVPKPSKRRPASPAASTDTPVDLVRLRARREDIIRHAAHHGAHNVRVFGSAARDEAASTSDVDLLVEMEEGRSLLDLVALWQELEELLQVRVDVISDGGVSPHLRGRIYSEAVPL